MRHKQQKRKGPLNTSTSNTVVEASPPLTVNAPSATSSATGLPAFIDAADFLEQSLIHPPELVQGLLHQGSKLAVGGGSKSFKTWNLLSLGIAVASGEPWLSLATTKGRVLFLNFEIQAPFLQERIRAIQKATEISLPRGQMDIMNLRGQATSHSELIPRIIKQAKGREYSLIVVDPIYKLYGATDENSAGAVAQLLNSLEKLAVETGAAIAFAAHYSKGDQSRKESIDRISGSGVFARDPDSLLMFTKHETDDAFTVEATLRNFASPPSFVVRWEHPMMRRDDSLDPSRLKRAAGRKQKHNPLELLKAIEDSSSNKPVSVSQWATAVGLARPTLIGYLPTIRSKGWIATAGEGNKARQHITLKGLQALEEACQK